jgi:amino acid transporter
MSWFERTSLVDAPGVRHSIRRGRAQFTLFGLMAFLALSALFLRITQIPGIMGAIGGAALLLFGVGVLTVLFAAPILVLAQLSVWVKEGKAKRSKTEK